MSRISAHLSPFFSSRVKHYFRKGKSSSTCMGLNLILAFAMRSPKVLQYILIFSALTLRPAICGDAPVIDRSNFDMKIQPGDDFYQFTNGGWLDRNPIPPEY